RFMALRQPQRRSREVGSSLLKAHFSPTLTPNLDPQTAENPLTEVTGHGKASVSATTRTVVVPARKGALAPSVEGRQHAHTACTGHPRPRRSELAQVACTGPSTRVLRRP